MRRKDKDYSNLDSGIRLSPWRKLFPPKSIPSNREESTEASSFGDVSAMKTTSLSMETIGKLSTRDKSPQGSLSSRNDPESVVSDISKVDGKSTIEENLSLKSSTFRLNNIDSLVPISPSRKNERIIKARVILSRPFTRASIPPRKGYQNWVVEVSPAEWDGDQERWKYRILVQRRQLRPYKQNDAESCLETTSSFTTAFTWRSLSDFIWLEEALRAEYHGALILPLLSIAVGTPDLAAAQYEVDAILLKDWLGDILNGIRGQGEIMIDQSPINIMSSEAIEAFLYRNTDPLPIISTHRSDQIHSNPGSVSRLDLPWKDSPEKSDRDASFVTSLWTKPFDACTNFDHFCANGKYSSAENQQLSKAESKPLSFDLMKANCSSRAIETTASLEIQDSFVQYDVCELDSSSLVIQSQLIEAIRELVDCYRNLCLSAMEKLNALKEEESFVAAAWKKFAASLSSLYSYEKEVESSRVGDSKDSKEKMPFRKLSKTTVDELVRTVSKQKLDRSVLSLSIVENMLKAYMGDLSAVGPSVKSYSEAISQLAKVEQYPVDEKASHNRKEKSGVFSSWKETISALYGIVDMVKNESARTASTTKSATDYDLVSQKKAFENRVFINERLLRESLISLCRATPIRCARLVYHYYTSEAIQVTILQTASSNLRKKVNVITPDKLRQLRDEYSLEIDSDDVSEIDLIQRIIKLGDSNWLKTSNQAHDKDAKSMREKVMTLAHDRCGKWNSELALAIMEAVGIDDAEVQVEETTRDLRLVRRHAIGLRENLSRCMESLEVLKSVILFVHHGSLDSSTPRSKSIRDARREFVRACSLVFSGIMLESKDQSQPRSGSPSISILENAGIKLNDPAGWLSSVAEQKSKVSCGASLLAYLESRDTDTEAFLAKLERQLQDYKIRIEFIESYVYMQCVGIQLEKHFSKIRANALAAFEKKTDIQTAVNIAQRKKLPVLVKELTEKLNAIAPGVTHTTVKESKEAHLLSKSLKTEIGDLALRRFQRVKETSMDRIVSLMSIWAKYEEVIAGKELQLLKNGICDLEKSLSVIDIDSDGISKFLKEVKKKNSRTLSEV